MPGPGTCSAGPCSWYGDHKCICADKGLYPQMVANRRPPPNNINAFVPAPWGTPSQLLPKPKTKLPDAITDEINTNLDSIVSKLTGNGKWISPQTVDKILEDIITVKELVNNA